MTQDEKVQGYVAAALCQVRVLAYCHREIEHDSVYDLIVKNLKLALDELDGGMFKRSPLYAVLKTQAMEKPCNVESAEY